ncbi:hypothetical protein CGRA01v4_09053 [Colletotrichum graminicola]|nr:hypothetical protein CGRA01v4_09053 [Colletotrichum graminicola]
MMSARRAMPSTGAATSTYHMPSWRPQGNTTDGCERPILGLLTGTDHWDSMCGQTLDKHSGPWFPAISLPCIVARRVHGSLDSFTRLKLTSQSMSLFSLPQFHVSCSFSFSSLLFHIPHFRREVPV